MTFGKLPTKIITGLDIRLKDILANTENNKYKSIDSIDFENKFYKILPCYFPVGRGNPNKAKYILNYIKNTF